MSRQRRGEPSNAAPGFFTTLVQLANAQYTAEAQYAALEDDCARVSHALTQIDVDNTHTNYKLKSDKKSDKLRKKGNVVLNFNNDLALKLYTESIANAVPNNKSLSLGYANRAVVLSAMGHYIDAIADNQRAIASGYPESLQYKLYSRLGKCYGALKEFGKSLKCSNTALRDMDKSDLTSEAKEKFLKLHIQPTLSACQTSGQEVEEDLKDLTDDPLIGVLKLNIPRLRDNFNPEVPSAVKNVVLKYNQQFGRHLVATKDFQIGDILIVDEPYSAVLMEKNAYTYCSHCLLRSRTLQPCPTCSWAMFCSSDCKTAADIYHKHECLYMPSIFKYGGKQEQCDTLRLAIRAVTRHGLDYMDNFLSSYTPATFSTDEQRRQAGFNKDGKYVSTDVNCMANLCCHPETKSSRVMHISVQVANIMKLMKFDKLQSSYKLGGFLFKLLSSVGCNGGSAIKEYVPGASEVKKLHYYGITICPTYSLINQNCIGNTFAHFYGKTQVVRALRTIKKGEQLFVIKSFGTFLNIPLDVRQQKLKDCHFTCTCNACTKNWPLLDSLPSLPDISIPRDADLVNALSGLSGNGLTEEITHQNLSKYREIAMKFDTSERYQLCRVYHLLIQRLRNYYLRDGNHVEGNAYFSEDYITNAQF